MINELNTHLNELNYIENTNNELIKSIKFYENILNQSEFNDVDITKISQNKLQSAKEAYNLNNNKKIKLQSIIQEKKQQIGIEILDYLKIINSDVHEYLSDVNKRKDLKILIESISESIDSIKELYNFIDLDFPNSKSIQNNNNNELKSIPNPFNKKDMTGYILDPDKEFSKYSLYSREYSLNDFFKDHKSDIQKVVSQTKSKEEAIKYLKNKHGLCHSDTISLSTFNTLCSQHNIKNF